MDQDDGFLGKFDANEEDAAFLQVRIENVSISNLGFIVFLRHKTESRVLPIFIGGNEAHSIAKILNGQATPRPMTHDLMHQMLDTLGWTLKRIHVTHILDNTFYARIFLSHEIHPPMDFDARPSDALALALRFQSEILVHHLVYEQASVPIAKEVRTDAAKSPSSETNMPQSTLPKEGLKSEKGSAKTEEVQDLQKRLAHAIHEELYEEAAKLRDALRVALKRLQDGN